MNATLWDVGNWALAGVAALLLLALLFLGFIAIASEWSEDG